MLNTMPNTLFTILPTIPKTMSAPRPNPLPSSPGHHLPTAAPAAVDVMPPAIAVTFHLAIELIKRFEGFRSLAYICPAGFLTIGYGHVITTGEQYLIHKPLPADAAETLLQTDLIHYHAAMTGLLSPLYLTPRRAAALLSFTYNCGVAALERSRLRMVFNRGQWATAGEELLRWNKVRGQSLMGLTRRRQAEHELYFSDSMPAPA